MLHTYDRSVDADVIDLKAYGSKANEFFAKYHSRDDDAKKAAFEKRKALAGLGGFAELETLEGDFYNLAIYRDNPVLDFVEMRNLPLGTLPFYRTRYAPTVGFYMGSVNAMGSTVYYATQDQGQTVTPFTIQSDEVMVPNLHPIYDMERVGQRAAALERLAYAMKQAIVNVALNTMFRSTNVIADDPATSLVNYFNTGGSFSGKNVYVLDPGVVPAGVPTTNVFDLHGEGGLTKGVFQALNDYSIQAGRTIRKLYVPSAGVNGYPVWRSLQDSSSVVSIANGAGNQNPSKAVTEEQWAQFQRDDYRSVVESSWFGLNVQIERQNWLPAGYVLALTDQPSVVMWDRLNLATGEDRAGTLEVPVAGYMSRRSEARNIATVSPDFALRNFVLLKVQ